MMDFLLGWLREYREVLKHAKFVAVLLVLLGLLGGLGLGTLLYQRQVQEAQLALSSAQSNRDLWKDRYDELAQAKTPFKPRPPAPVVTITRARIDWFLVGVWSTVGILAVLGGLMFVPLPKGQPQSREIKSNDPPPIKGWLIRGTAKLLPARENRTGADESAFNYAVAYLARHNKEREARPHIAVASVERDIRPNQVVVIINIENVTKSLLVGCQVVVESIATDGPPLFYMLPVASGRERANKVDLREGERRGLALLHRNYDVAPEEDVILNTTSTQNPLLPQRRITLSDNATHVVNILIDPKTGVKTRAVVEVRVGEYENMEVSLLGQSSWRL